jgi:hypothetical protein
MGELTVSPDVTSAKRRLVLPRGWEFEQGKEWSEVHGHYIWIPRLYNKEGNRVLFEFVPNGKLVSHEKLIEENVRRILKKIVGRGYYTKFIHTTPLGGGKMMIVDGHHRNEAVNRLVGGRTPSLIHDPYSDVKLGTWYPALEIVQFEKALESASPIACRYEVALGRVATGEAYFAAVLPDGKCYSFACPKKDLATVFELQENFLKAAGGVSNDNYIRDGKKPVGKALSENKVVLVRRALTHDEVLGIARAGKTCPPKSTRHYELPDLWLPVLPDMFKLENISEQNLLLSYYVGIMASGQHPLGLDNPLEIKRA